MFLLVKLLIALIILTVIALAGIIVHAGGFTRIRFCEREFGALPILFDCHIGDYARSGKVINAVYEDAIAAGIACDRGFGTFHDNPRQTPKQHCRAELGVILDAPLTEAQQAQISKTHQTGTLPAGIRLTTEMPYRNTLSIILGVFKVYPALTHYTAETGMELDEVTEIYDRATGKILYLASMIPQQAK